MSKSQRSLNHSVDFPLLQGKDGSETKKEVRRDEVNLGDTAWRDLVRPHSSPNKEKKKDCDKYLPSATAWKDPVQSTSSQHRNTGQSL